MEILNKSTKQGAYKQKIIYYVSTFNYFYISGYIPETAIKSMTIQNMKAKHCFINYRPGDITLCILFYKTRLE